MPTKGTTWLSQEWERSSCTCPSVTCQDSQRCRATMERRETLARPWDPSTNAVSMGSVGSMRSGSGWSMGQAEIQVRRPSITDDLVRAGEALG